LKDANTLSIRITVFIWHFSLCIWERGFDEAIVKQQTKDPKLGLDKIQTELLEILSFDPVPLDTLVEVSKWPIGKLAPVLVSLELSSCIANDNGFYQRLI